MSRPCYLADLSAARPNASHSIKLAHMSFELEADGTSRPFAGRDSPVATVPVGSVVELMVGGTSVMHHVFHMQ